MGGAGQRGLPVPRLLSLQLPPHRCCIHNGGVRRRGHHIGHATVTCDWYALHSVQPQRGEVELIGTVEPFASQIRLSGVGKHFNFPYDQAAGKLTNLIVTRSDIIKEKPEAVRQTVAAVVSLVDMLNKDKVGWVDSIVKGTGLDRGIATEALKNAYPDYNMYRGATLAIADMMKELKYISRDVSGDITKNMDYSFLVSVTGKTPKELGY